jgi:hypothetical protein
MDRIFLHIPGEEGSLIVNLLQVTQVSDVTDDQLVLRMSDGNTITLNGKEMVDHVVRLVCDYALTVDGKPMRMHEEEVSPEPTKTES